MTKWYVSLLTFLYIATSYGSTDLDNNYVSLLPYLNKKITRAEAEYLLKDLPKWSPETKRWYMYADHWHADQDGNFLLKGKYLAISENSKISQKIRFYSSPNKESPSSYEFEPGILYKDHKEYCQYSPIMNSRKVERFSRCVYGFCNVISKKREVFQNYFPDLFVAFDLRSYCPEKLNVLSIGPSRGALKYAFPEMENPSNGFFKVKISDRFYFLELKECREKLKCTFGHKGNYSFFELKWMALKYLIQKKNLNSLNVLIRDLLPCVDRKDLACVKTFFISKKDYENERNNWLVSHKNYESQTVDESTLKELKSCLDYKNLLHVEKKSFVTRGISKACLFVDVVNNSLGDAENTKVLSVSYPEAIRESDGSLELYVPL